MNHPPIPPDEDRFFKNGNGHWCFKHSSYWRSSAAPHWNLHYSVGDPLRAEIISDFAVVGWRCVAAQLKELAREDDIDLLAAELNAAAWNNWGEGKPWRPDFTSTSKPSDSAAPSN